MFNFKKLIFIIFLNIFFLSHIYANYYDLTPGNKKYLLRLSKETWNCINYLSQSPMGLPYDDTKKAGYTSTSNIGMYLTSIIIAYKFNFISKKNAIKRINKILNAYKKFKKFDGFCQTWNSVLDCSPLYTDRWVSLLDTGNLIFGFITVKEFFPGFKTKIEEILKQMNYEKFYNKYKRELYGGINARDGLINKNWKLELIGADSRLISFYFVALGIADIEYWNDLKRKYEGHHKYKYFQPGMMGGGLFMQYYSGLYLDERFTILGKSAANFAYMQMIYAKKNNIPVWGWSASDSPHHGYLGWAALKNDVVTPHASVLASVYYPDKVIKNLKEFDKLGVRKFYKDENKRYAFGFKDAYDLKSKDAAQNYLLLDQSFIFLTLGNILLDGILWETVKKDKIIQAGLQKINDYKKNNQLKQVYQKRDLEPLTDIFEQDDTPKKQAFLITDFENEEFKNKNIKKIFEWKNCSEEDQGVEIEIEEVEDNRKHVLMVDYDVESKNSAWNAVWFKLKELDARGYNSIGFDIKGDYEKGIPNQIKIEFHNSSGIFIYRLKNIKSTWQRIYIPFKHFSGFFISKQGFTDLAFMFEDSKVGSKNGRIYLDNINFKYLGSRK